MLELIREMTAAGATVVMCTHLLLEAEGLADQVVVLEDGTRPRVGHTAASSPGATGRTRSCGSTPSSPSRARSARATSDGVSDLRPRRTGHRAMVQLDDMTACPTSSSALAAAGVRLTRVEPHEPTLEDLYFAVRGAAAGTGVGRDQTPIATAA